MRYYELAERNPKAKDQDPKLFFDDRLVRQLEASGFFETYIGESIRRVK